MENGEDIIIYDPFDNAQDMFIIIAYFSVASVPRWL